jgi:HEAT repeat protein
MRQVRVDAPETRDHRQLIEQLGSPDFAVSQAASKALFARGADALDALVEGLAHPNWRVRTNCAGLMDHLGDSRCVAPLQRALRDPVAGVRRLAIHALGCQPCKAAPLQADIVGLLIERVLSDPSPRVRRVAVHMLGLQSYDTRAVAALETILERETDDGLLSRARRALEEQRKKADAALVANCPAHRWRRGQRAAW